jgi:hypothetical protein
MMRSLVRFLSTPLLLLAACGGSASGPATSADLSRALTAAQQLEVVLPHELSQASGTEPRPLRARIELAARTLAERRGVEVKVVEAAAAGSSTTPRIVLGTAEDPLVRDLLSATGAHELEGGGFGWEGCVLQEAGDALLACFEDPERPGLPLNLLVTEQLGDLLGLCDDLTPRSRPGLLHLSRQSTALEVPLSVRGRRLRGAGREADDVAWRSVASTQTYGIRRDLAVAPELALTFVEQLDACLARLESWAGAGTRRYQEFLLVSSPARQRAMTGSAGLAVRSSLATRSVVLVLPGLEGDGGAGAAAEQARAVLGEPAAAWMHVGAGIDAADRWWGRELSAWGAHLAVLGLLPTPEQLSAADSVDRLSKHILAPARGLLWRYLRETVSREDLLALWRGELGLSVDPLLFEQWVGAASSESAAAGRESRLQALGQQGFWRGLCLASDLQPGGGLDSEELGASLAAARASGANAASVTSFFTEAQGVRGLCGGSLPLGRQSLEGDAALACVLSRARVAGLNSVALQPRLLISESSGYSVWQRLTLLWHWEEFFSAFEPFVAHYALLAELASFDLLTLGSDLSTPQLGAGLAPEVASYREEHLRSSLHSARAAFGGALCYSASWPGEVQSFGSWDAVDYVGVSWFPFGPERGASPPGERELRGLWRGQLAAVAKVAAEAGKPWLVAEFGVRSTEGGATDTRLGLGRASEQTQLTALGALRGVLEDLSRTESAPQGVFWWRWGASSEADPRGYALTPESGASLRALVRED